MDIDRSHARCHALEPDSSDEDESRERYRVEIIPSVMLEGESSAPSSASGTRRKVFAKSKSVKTCYSMPAPDEPDLTSHVPKERRKSMPPNMKMPTIKVTPSSPSPDPNHPDYPEFFEDKLYLEHVTRQKSDVTPRPEAEAQVSFDSFTLVLEPDDSEEEVIPDEDMREGFRLCHEKSALKNKRKPNVESKDTVIS